MPVNGLLINYHYCTGCRTCEVACQQEHGHPPGQSGIVVTEYVMRGRRKPVAIDNLPFLTEQCVLCARRTNKGDLPACVKHCQGQCMQFGPLEELVLEMLKSPRSVLYRPL